MSSGYQQPRDPKEGPSASVGVLPTTIKIPDRSTSKQYVSPGDSLWGNFDADFTLSEAQYDAPTAPNRILRRRPGMRLLRASSLPSSTPVGPRMTEREWQEIDQCLEDRYDFPRVEGLYSPPLAKTSQLIAEQQPSSGIIRSRTVPTVPAAGRPRMVLEDDDEMYLPQVRARLRKRDRFKLIGVSLASKFRKLGRAETYTGRPAS